MTDRSVLIVAFDGLDKELIEEFKLEHIPQQEFGKIDNQSKMSGAFTSELFASFITGENYKKHGIKGLNKSQGAKEIIVDRIFSEKIIKKVRGANRLRNTLETLLDIEKERPNKYDLKKPSLFDKIENSKGYFVPSWNPSPYWQALTFGELKAYDVDPKSLDYYWDNYEFETRKRRTFRPINKWFDLCMIHFHRVDAHQHFYGDKSLSTYDESKLENLYHETDKLASKIHDYFSDDYDLIIFMSDHGLPTEEEHNENAFYSSNRELFGDSTPKITDFYDKILEFRQNASEI